VHVGIIDAASPPEYRDDVLGRCATGGCRESSMLQLPQGCTTLDDAEGMSQPAPDWHAQVPHAAPPAPPAPPAPAVPASVQHAAAAPSAAPPQPYPVQPYPVQVDAPAPMPPGMMPTEAIAALDVTAPLAAPPGLAAPAVAAAPAPASSPDAAAPAVDPNTAWWAPAHALVLAMAALTWQFIAYYASEQLPVLQTSGAPLTKLDEIVGNVPLIGTAAGPFFGMALAAGALAMLLVGTRKGVRAPGLQLAVGAIAAMSILLVVALPRLVG
jgi:hypothetical protein